MKMKRKYKSNRAISPKSQTRYVGEKLPLYAKGNVVGVQLGNDASYFGTDMLGSVRSVTDGYGSVKNLREYDVFGNPLETCGYSSGLEYGYAGKPYDAVTEMYNYGFRDYSPATARFTTLDPIRDGTNWFSYVANDPVNFVDLWGLAPRNIPEKERTKYIYELSKYTAYSREKDNKMSLPDEYDCADVATYLYDKCMTSAGIPNNLSSLNHEGNNIKTLQEMQSQDYFPDTGNISYYDGTEFNNPYIEVGSVMVWQGPGIDPITGKGWIGHVATIVDVQRDKNGDVTKISIIQGHTGGYKSEVVKIVDQKDLDEYIGIFLGFGEIGRGSLEKMPTNFQGELKNGVVNTVTNSTTKNNCNK